MRLRIRLGDKSLSFGVGREYNHLLQSVIYSSLPGPVSSFFHDIGYAHGKRAYKMVTFSRLRGCCVPDGEMLQYRGVVELTVCSPSSCFCHSLATSLLRLGTVRIGHAVLPVSGVTVEAIPENRNTVRVRTISPVVAYSTLFRREGTKYTCYYSPRDPEFGRIVSENAVRKLVAFGSIDEGDAKNLQHLRISLLGNPRMTITRFKDTVIKAYDARLEISGDPKLVNIVQEAGLGSKNAQGFGCLDPIELAL